MKRNQCGGARLKGGFRLEWEGNGRSGTVYLFGVESFGEYGEKSKTFLTDGGKVTVYGVDLTVETFRSGCVEVAGRIFGVSLDETEGRDHASD